MISLIANLIFIEIENKIEKQLINENEQIKHSNDVTNKSVIKEGAFKKLDDETKGINY